MVGGDPRTSPTRDAAGTAAIVLPFSFEAND